MKQKSQSHSSASPPPAVIAVRAPSSAVYDSRDVELIRTPDAARIMEFSEATLRNYVWLQSLPRTERAARRLQDPPAGLPKPKRLRGKLMWAKPDVERFAKEKNKVAP